MSGTAVVDKRRYDALFSAYGKAVLERNRLRDMWNELKTIVMRFDDRVLEDIHRFESLEEENAYLIGSFNTLLAMKYNLEELEEKHDVQTGNK